MRLLGLRQQTPLLSVGRSWPVLPVLLLELGRYEVGRLADCRSVGVLGSRAASGALGWVSFGRAGRL